MARCLISFGANLGNAQATVLAACEQLRQLLPPGDQVHLSRLYQTPPVGGPSGQPPFVNAVAALDTSLNPWEVWHRIRTVEQQMGRQRIRRWEARKIDLDILLYEDLRIWTGQLKIPHPRMCMRRFILLPALDVAADWLDPVTEWTVEQLASQVSSGKGTLVLVADSDMKPEVILEEVSRASHARWIPTEQLALGSPMDDSQRAVSWISTEEFFGNWERSLHPSCGQSSTRLTKLWFFLKPSDSSDSWEDRYRELAMRLRLASGTSDAMASPGKATAFEHQPRPQLPPSSLPSILPAGGPRYLLATCDPGWAVHELVAALDAMDCPVESLVVG